MARKSVCFEDVIETAEEAWIHANPVQIFGAIPPQVPYGIRSHPNLSNDVEVVGSVA